MDVTKGTSLITKPSTYDTLKDLNTIALPGAAALYAGLAIIWNWPGGEQVVGTVALIVTFGSILLKIASKQYENAQPEAPVDGGLLVINTSSPSADPVSANFSIDPLSLPSGTDVLLTVRNDTNEDDLPPLDPGHAASQD